MNVCTRKTFVKESRHKWGWQSLTYALQNNFHFPFLKAVFTVHAKLLQANISLKPLNIFFLLSLFLRKWNLPHIIYTLQYNLHSPKQIILSPYLSRAAKQISSEGKEENIWGFIQVIKFQLGYGERIFNHFEAAFPFFTSLMPPMVFNFLSTASVGQGKHSTGLGLAQ